ncbi:MAG: FtsX-like permease family protein, partial [Bryobacteraceae bacterium]
LGSWGVWALLAFMPGDLPRVREIAAIPALDPQVAGFTLGLAILTGVLFGLAPVFHLSGLPPTMALNEGGRAGAGRKQSRAHGVLVASEVAIAVVLLCGAVLLIRSFAALHSEKLGFDSNHLLTMEISLAGPGYSKSSFVDRLARRFVERAERIPGVESAALASALPLSGKMDMIFNIPGRMPSEGRHFNGDVQWRFVSPHYFGVLRIPLLSGRLLRDGESGRTVVISQTMARRFWPDTNAVGQIIFIGPDLGRAYRVGLTEIVGVVGDVRERLGIDPQPVMYQSPAQIPDADMALLDGYEPTAILVRTRMGIAPMSVSQAVQRTLLGEQRSVAKVRTMEQTALDSTARQNFNLLLLGLFAAIALLLAAVGIYGVMSYSVQQRRHEIGIRSALGASPRQTISLVLRQALRMTLAGAAAGVAASFGLTPLIRAQLFGVKPQDPLTFTAVPLILIAVGLSAASIPAVRASRVDPLAALRQE